MPHMGPMPHMMDDAAFRAYAIACSILVFKMSAAAILTASTRTRVKQFLNPEDAGMLGTTGAEEEHPEVQRMLRMHRNERSQLEVAGIHAPPGTAIPGRDARREFAVEPRERMLCRELRRCRRRNAHVERTAHQHHRARLGGIACSRQQRHRGEHRRYGLADRNDVHLGPE